MVVCKFFQQGYCRFGQSCRFEHEYGSKYSYRAPQTQKNEAFSSSATLFRNAVQQNTSVFGNAPQTSVFTPVPQQRSVFDRLGDSQPTSVFNRVGNVQPRSVFDRLGDNTAKSVFAQANQSINQPFQPSNPFQTTRFTGPSVFSSLNTVQANQSNAASIFASAAQRVPQNDPFKPQSSGNVFQISEQPRTNVFGVMPVIEQNVNDDGIYSKIEDLSPSDIEAFESSDFKLGFIPEVPPPKSLCV